MLYYFYHAFQKENLKMLKQNKQCVELSIQMLPPGAVDLD